MAMPECCVHSFVFKGLSERFELAKEGDEHQCEECGRVYVLKDGKWALKSQVDA